MPVAAGVVGDGRVRAGVVLAAGDMAAERRRAAALDCAHHLQLVEADVSAVGFTPSGTVVAEDIRDLQSWPPHRRRRLGRRFGLMPLPRPLENCAQGTDQTAIAQCAATMGPYYPQTATCAAATFKSGGTAACFQASRLHRN